MWLNATTSGIREGKTSPNGRVKLRHGTSDPKKNKTRDKYTSRVIRAGLCQLAISKATAMNEKERNVGLD
jgi:hypothetical protein